MNKNIFKQIIGPVVAIVLLLAVVLVIAFDNYADKKGEQIQVKSQYTYKVLLDEEYKQVEDSDELNDTSVGIPAQDDMVKVARMWVEGYTGQFTQAFMPNSKALKEVNVDNVTLLDDDKKIVKITFSANLKDESTEFFDSWNAINNNGRIICEWIVEFNMVQEDSGYLMVAVKNISNSEGYSIIDNNWYVVDSFKQSDEGNGDVYTYDIDKQSLNVTYDGGKTWLTVPVDVNMLLTGSSGRNTLVAGTYIITEEKTAFLYGSTPEGESDKQQLTIIYSDDKGSTWTSAKIADVDSVSGAYMQFLDEGMGYVAYAHDKESNGEKVEIAKTSDGGETWEWMGTAPEKGRLSDIGFVSESVGFVCYSNTSRESGRIYITRDGGASFVKLNFPQQTLISTDDKAYVFSEVFCIYEVPYLDKGILVAKIYQPDGVNYNNGVYAQYKSQDYGQNWIFDGYYEQE